MFEVGGSVGRTEGVRDGDLVGRGVGELGRIVGKYEGTGVGAALSDKDGVMEGKVEGVLEGE